MDTTTIVVIYLLSALLTAPSIVRWLAVMWPKGACPEFGNHSRTSYAHDAQCTLLPKITTQDLMFGSALSLIWPGLLAVMWINRRAHAKPLPLNETQRTGVIKMLEREMEQEDRRQRQREIEEEREERRAKRAIETVMKRWGS
jgi:hypothetical protein